MPTAIAEGCVGETLAAAEASEASRVATDPTVATVLAGIAEDEARHAALAWRFVVWAIESAPAETRERIASELERLVQATVPAPARDDLPSELAQHGFVVGSRRSALRAQVASQVIGPCARALARRARGQPARPRDSADASRVSS